MAASSWKQKSGTLYRGDVKDGVALPVPDAEKSLVRHILYLEGYGRTTPYLSTSESKDTASHFAGTTGHVYEGTPRTWPSQNVAHRSRRELLQLLRGKGHGDAKWNSAFEVLRAYQYVEEHLEHLADFSSTTPKDNDDLTSIVSSILA